MRAGKYIADNISKMKHAPIDAGQIAKQKEMVFAPKAVKRGVTPLEVEVKIRDIVERCCGPERSEGSINQGLWRLKSVRDRFLPELIATDTHELMSAQEVRNLFLLAEVYMLCARERKESGMRTFRLDYPDKADDPWKKAIVARMEKGAIKLSRTKMPKLREEIKG
jgi:succinate dehydrogenase/fumarate reductase flavoprotein subunit